MTTNQRAGTALIVATIVTGVALMFHPTGRDVIMAGQSGGSNARDMIVHAIAIAGEIVMLIGTLALTARLASQRDLAVSAFVVYAFATFALVIAATASGLIAPSVAEHLAGADEAGKQGLLTMFSFNGHINAAFARLGFSLAAIAITMWSVAMLRDGLSRALAVYGLIAGPLMLVGLVLGFEFSMHGFGGLVMGAQLVWTIGAGVVLRGKP